MALTPELSQTISKYVPGVQASRLFTVLYSTVLYSRSYSPFI